MLYGTSILVIEQWLDRADGIGISVHYKYDHQLRVYLEGTLEVL